jgi:hypothetical protein
MPTDIPIIGDVMAFIGTVLVAGGGGAVVAFGLIRLFAEKWLNTKFEERLESLKQEHRKEIERLRLTINTLMDRATKLHQREFDALPEVWGRLNDAFVRTCGLAFQFQPNIDDLPEEQLNDYLSKSPLEKWEQAAVKAATDKTGYYASRMVVHSLGDAFTTYNNYGLYLRKNGIFIESRLRDKFYEFEKLIQEALAEQHINVQQHNPLRPWKSEKLAELDQKGRSLLTALEREVRGRLWNADPNA